MSNSYQLYCCGSRGSRPVEGRRFNEFGGFTSCYVLKKENYALIIDCGTGLYEANAIILDCPVVDVLLTHMHYDHILGVLDWTALPAKSKVTFYSGFDKWSGAETMEDFFRRPFWPEQPNFVLRNTPPAGSPLILQEDLSVRFFPAPHPNDAQLMVITTSVNDDTHNLVVMFDSERPGNIPQQYLENCDYLLYDGMYTDAEYPSKKGYGHSTWQEACRYATHVNCKRLIVTHHDPNRNDEDLRKFERLARDVYPSTDFARSGQNWPFPYREPSQRDKAPNKKRSLMKRIIDSFTEIILSDEKRSRFTGIASYALLGFISLIMTFVNIATAKELLMLSTLTFAGLCSINILLDLVFHVNYKAVQVIFQIEMLILLTFFVVSGTPEGFSALWVLMLPVAGMFVFGKKRNTVLCIIMLCILIYFLYTPDGRNFLQYQYTDSFLLRFPIAFMAFFALAYFLETVRERTFREIENLRNSQADTIADQTSELREQNFNMLRVNSELALTNRLLRETLGEQVPETEATDSP